MKDTNTDTALPVSVNPLLLFLVIRLTLDRIFKIILETNTELEMIIEYDDDDETTRALAQPQDLDATIYLDCRSHETQSKGKHHFILTDLFHSDAQ